MFFLMQRDLNSLPTMLINIHVLLVLRQVKFIGVAMKFGLVLCTFEICDQKCHSWTDMFLMYMVYSILALCDELCINILIMCDLL